jgi:cellobiose phosphorylase
VLATALQGNGDRAFELYQMINPLTHASTRADAEQYKVEPYVVVADLYTAAGHLGRGGWTWYTGSASWMYRVGLEAILGFRKRGDKLAIEPCLPSAWKEYTIEYRHLSSTYTITVKNPDGVQRGRSEVVVDGQPVADAQIPLGDDGGHHEVTVVLRTVGGGV